MPENSIIELFDVSYKYASGTQALDGINTSIPKGKKIALLGSNGAGKSTLMLLLNGILKPSKGMLSFNGLPIEYDKKSLRNLRTKVGFIFHEPDNQLLAPSVYEEISFGLNNISNDQTWVREKVEEALIEFCLHDIQAQSPHRLSAGQKKRVCLASILAMQPELIICDEPSSSLDPFHTELTFNYLNDLHQKGKTILISTHDVNQAYQWADYVILLKKGQVVYNGTPKELFSNKEICTNAGLSQPFIVETSYIVNPEINAEDLPSTMDELKNILHLKTCMDL